jgi:hypothetical protein
MPSAQSTVYAAVLLVSLQVMSKEGNLVELADSALSGNVRIFGEIDPEWEVDPKSIVFQEKVGTALRLGGALATG